MNIQYVLGEFVDVITSSNANDYAHWIISDLELTRERLVVENIAMLILIKLMQFDANLTQPEINEMYRVFRKSADSLIQEIITEKEISR